MKPACLVLALLATAASAQDMGREQPETKPLVARWTEADGRIAIGGGPEVAAIIAAMPPESRLAATVSGADGAVPLLTQGTIAVALLPRDPTAIERLAIRRFAGGYPMVVAVTKDLRGLLRTDANGAIDARAYDAVTAMLSAHGQAAIAHALPDHPVLRADALAAARARLDGVPRVRLPDAARGYRLADGRYRIIGTDTLVTLLPALNAAFEARHPTIRFETDLRGSSLAMPALTASTSFVAPMGRDLWANDLTAFRQVRGYAPTRFRIAYAGWGPRPQGKTLPAPYVNVNNPVAGLDMTRFRRVFAAGAPGGDARVWGDVGMTGAWAMRPIHVYGVRDDGGFATALRLDRLNGLPYSARYRALPTREAVLAAVAADPNGIGYASWSDGPGIPTGVRMLPMAAMPAQRFVLPRPDANRGAWPLSSFVNVYVDRAPGTKLDAHTKRYLAFLLSEEGQAIIGGHVDEDDGPVRLDPSDLTTERRKLSSL